MLKTAGAPRGTSSTQKSDSGFNCIVPANNAIWKGFKFSVLVANGCDKNSTSVCLRIKAGPFLVIFPSTKSSLHL